MFKFDVSQTIACQRQEKYKTRSYSSPPKAGGLGCNGLATTMNVQGKEVFGKLVKEVDSYLRNFPFGRS